MPGLLFITAPAATPAQINLLLLHLRDWENRNGYNLALTTSRNGYALSRAGSSQPATSPPVDERLALENGWAGASLADVEGFCVDMGRGAPGAQPMGQMYIAVDEDGMREGNCVLSHRACVVEGEEFRSTEAFNKMRVPWEKAEGPWGIMEIGEMSLEDFSREGQEGEVDEAGNLEGEGPGGWFTFRFDESDMDEAAARRKEKTIRRFREKGWI